MMIGNIAYFMRVIKKYLQNAKDANFVVSFKHLTYVIFVML